MSRRCTAKPRASARDLFIRDLIIGGNFEKDIQLLWENLKKKKKKKKKKNDNNKTLSLN